MNPFFSLKEHISQFEKFSEHLKSDQAKIVQKLFNETGHEEEYIFGIGHIELNKTFLSGGVSQAINSINCMVEIYSGLNEELIIY